MEKWKIIRNKLKNMDNKYVAIDLFGKRPELNQKDPIQDMHIAKIHVTKRDVLIYEANGIAWIFEHFIEKYPYCKFYYCDIQAEIQ